jgi:hypothetical protein
MAVLNVNTPFAATVRLSPALFCRTSPVPVKPETVPPIEKLPPEPVPGGPGAAAVFTPLQEVR